MQKDVKPWYKHPQPWLLLLGPIIVVIAGFYTAWLAFNLDDGMVVDDYYQEGKAINQRITRDKTAAEVNIEATLWLGQDQKTVRVLLQPPAGFDVGKALVLRFQHPTQSAADILLPLKEIAPNTYEAKANAPLSARWYISVEETHWRLTGEWQIEADASITLKPKAVK